MESWIHFNESVRINPVLDFVSAEKKSQRLQYLRDYEEYCTNVIFHA